MNPILQSRQISNALRWSERPLRKLLPRQARPLARRVKTKLLAGRLTFGSRDQIYSTSLDTRRQVVLAAIEAALNDRGAGVMRGGIANESIPIVHLRQADLPLLLSAVLDVAVDFEVMVRRLGRWRSSLDRELISNIEGTTDPLELLIVERVTESANGDSHTQCSRVRLNTWQKAAGAYGGGYYESGRELDNARRIRVPTFEKMLRANHDFADDIPATAPLPPIDIVYTWVDGDDPEWAANRNRYVEGGKSKPKARTVHEERFRSRDELLYSLRSVELFAPWVRNIFIVTAGQTPAWLNTAHPKIKMVDHTEIFADQSWLPTFNSSAIETQLHHIDGLSDRFLYFNDDFFLGQYCEPADFFSPDGGLYYFDSGQRAYEPDIDTKSEEYIQADKNAIELFQQEFGWSGRSTMKHVPYPSDREMLYELEAKYQKLFDTCASQRFRSSKDVRPIAFMQYQYGRQFGKATAGGISHRYLALYKEHIADQLASTLLKRSSKTICINDVGLPAERTKVVNAAVAEFLENYFPLPSAFEHPGS